tara:strand:- start:707 stop:919 length:213 start_codon:yes stop_codon:yes gene_type:complete
MKNKFDKKVKQLVNEMQMEGGLKILAEMYVKLQLESKFFELELGSRYQEGEITLEQLQKEETKIFNEITK